VTGGDGGALPRVAAAGDSALMLSFAPEIDPAVNDRARAAAAALRERWAAILRDIVVGYATVCVSFDPLTIDARWLESEMQSAAADAVDGAPPPGAVIEVPVCYDAEFALDLADVAAFAGCSIDDAIALHTGRDYRVYMIGFVPGFPYLAEVDARIAVPRRATPRPAVPPGSVAVAGGQTGIYPSSTPGGWNIIGRTPLRPFDADREEPCLFQPGDTVRFVRIARADFDGAS
jgi:inhibitor of KinA